MRNNFNAETSPLTLVIPSFNRGDLIAETLDAALGQSTPFAEVIVVDDGSTDGTADVLRAFDGRIRVIRTGNQGVQAARNTGVAAARTDHVTLCDSDDLLESNFVSLVANWLARHPEIDIVYSNFRTFDDRRLHLDKFASAPEGWFEGSTADGDFRVDIPDLYMRTLQFQPLFPTGATFSKHFYQKIDGFDTRFNRIGAEDWEFTLRAVASGRVALCMRPLARVRKHGNNDSADQVRQLLGEAFILEHALSDHAPARAHADTVRASVTRRRNDAFSNAFAAGDFDTVAEIIDLNPTDPGGLAYRAKRLIAGMPPGMRDMAWRLTQRNRGT